MAVIIKALAQGQLPTSTTSPLYTAPPASPGPARAAIVKNMRFVNVSGSSVTINIYFRRGSGGTFYRVLTKDMSVAAAQLVIANEEVTLEPDDRIYGTASAGTSVDYVFSGVERDAS